MTREQEMWNYLASKGLSEYGIAAILANIKRESNYKSNNLQSSGNNKLGVTDEEFTQKLNSGEYPKEKFVKDSFGYGLCQWTYSSRKESLYNFLKGRKLAFDNWQGQLDFMLMELSYPYYKKSKEAVYGGTSCADSAKTFMLDYERPSDQSVNNQKIRAQLAEEIYISCNMRAQRDRYLYALEDIKRSIEEINDILKGVM